MDVIRNRIGTALRPAFFRRDPGKTLAGPHIVALRVRFRAKDLLYVKALYSSPLCYCAKILQVVSLFSEFLKTDHLS